MPRFPQQEFEDWMNDGNVIKFHDGYSTQDAQWKNRLSMRELKAYFNKQFGI